MRLAEDIRDEEEEGGIRRPWLSAFEFTKLMTTTPEPRCLDWMALWFSNWLHMRKVCMYAKGGGGGGVQQ